MKLRGLNFVTMAVFFALLVGCGGQSKSLPDPAKPPVELPADLKLREARGVQLQILNLKKFKQILAKGQHPSVYVVDGSLMKKDRAHARVDRGDVACYSYMKNYEPQEGEVIQISAVDEVRFESKKYFLTYISRVDKETQLVIGVACLKKAGPVEAGEASRALKGIVKFMH